MKHIKIILVAFFMLCVGMISAEPARMSSSMNPVMPPIGQLMDQKVMQQQTAPQKQMSPEEFNALFAAMQQRAQQPAPSMQQQPAEQPTPSWTESGLNLAAKAVDLASAASSAQSLYGTAASYVLGNKPYLQYTALPLLTYFNYMTSPGLQSQEGTANKSIALLTALIGLTQNRWIGQIPHLKNANPLIQTVAGMAITNLLSSYLRSSFVPQPGQARPARGPSEAELRAATQQQELRRIALRREAEQREAAQQQEEIRLQKIREEEQRKAAEAARLQKIREQENAKKPVYRARKRTRGRW